MDGRLSGDHCIRNGFVAFRIDVPPQGTFANSVQDPHGIRIQRRLKNPASESRIQRSLPEFDSSIRIPEGFEEKRHWSLLSDDPALRLRRRSFANRQIRGGRKIAL